MPRIPKWIGDTMETVFNGMIHPVTVSATEYLSENLKKVVLNGDLTKTKFTPGNVIEFRVTPTDFRHYTISRYDKEKGICEMLLYLHGNSVGSEWAAQLKKDDPLKMMGPGGKLNYSHRHTRHFIFGDETSVGLFSCLQAEALKNGDDCYCLAELDKNHSDWPQLVGVSAKVTGKSLTEPAKEAIEKIATLDRMFWVVWRHAAFYLTGRAKSIQAVRQVLLKKGVPLKSIQTEPYWAEGKKGL